MRLIAHRGLNGVLQGPGSNTMGDWERALRNDCDIEVDVRFHGKGIYCSHDQFGGDEHDGVGGIESFPVFLDLLAKFPRGTAFVNVKCDGMTADICALARTRGVLERIVTFDHSMPDFLTAETRSMSDSNYRVQRAGRSSPYEKPTWLVMPQRPWIWLDPIGIQGEEMVPFIERRLRDHELKCPNARVVVVSPDVHLKGGAGAASMARLSSALRSSKLLYGILTDMPKAFGFDLVP